MWHPAALGDPHSRRAWLGSLCPKRSDVGFNPGWENILFRSNLPINMRRSRRLSPQVEDFASGRQTKGLVYGAGPISANAWPYEGPCFPANIALLQFACKHMHVNECFRASPV